MTTRQRGSGPIAFTRDLIDFRSDEDERLAAAALRRSRGTRLRKRPRRPARTSGIRTKIPPNTTGAITTDAITTPPPVDLDDPDALEARNPSIGAASSMPERFALRPLTALMLLSDVQSISHSQIAVQRVAVASPVEAEAQPDSHVPLADPDEMPDGYPVKGNVPSMLYHLPGSPNYATTIAEVWFANAEAAERAGFARAHDPTSPSSTPAEASTSADTSTELTPELDETEEGSP